MSQDTRKAVRLRITGRVQGVGYRMWVVREAGRHGLDGWVRNRYDGSVEALVAGPADRVEEVIALCWRGPDVARVDDVVVTPAADPGQRGFTEAPSA